jgi:hypothetical protein
VVKEVAYVTDIRHFADVSRRRTEAYMGMALAARTFLTVTQPAFPGMLVEIEPPFRPLLQGDGRSLLVSATIRSSCEFCSSAVLFLLLRPFKRRQ